MIDEEIILNLEQLFLLVFTAWLSEVDLKIFGNGQFYSIYEISHIGALSQVHDGSLV